MEHKDHLCKIKKTQCCKTAKSDCFFFSFSCLHITLGCLRLSGRRDLEDPHPGRSPPTLEIGVLASLEMSIQPGCSLPETKG